MNQLLAVPLKCCCFNVSQCLNNAYLLNNKMSLIFGVNNTVPPLAGWMEKDRNTTHGLCFLRNFSVQKLKGKNNLSDWMISPLLKTASSFHLWNFVFNHGLESHQEVKRPVKILRACDPLQEQRTWLSWSKAFCKSFPDLFMGIS